MASKDQRVVIGIAAAQPLEQSALTSAPTAVGSFTAADGGTTNSGDSTTDDIIDAEVTRVAELVVEVAKIDTINTRIGELETILEKQGLLPGT